jgi:Na+-driven multidrug efflux pump
VGASSDNLILHGPIGRALLVLAGPVIAGEALHTAFHIVDLFWVRELGPWATASIVTSMFTLWIAFSLANLVTIGLAAHVSRAVGAGNRARAGHIVAQALWLCMLLSIPLMLFGGACVLLGVKRTLRSRAPARTISGSTLGMPRSST